MADPTLLEVFQAYFKREPTAVEILAFRTAWNRAAEDTGLPKISDEFSLDDTLILPGFTIDTDGDLIPPKEFTPQQQDLFFDTFARLTVEGYESELPKPKKPPGVDKTEAKAVYRQHLRDLGVWNPKNKDWTKELDQRFEDIWEEYTAKVATGEWQAYNNPSEFHVDLLEGISPETEKEFMAKFTEEQLYKEEFNEAFDRLLAQGGIEVPPELLNAVKALVGKEYVDAAYRGSAGTAQGFIMGSTVDAITKAQTQKEAGIKEDLLGQLVDAGDYSRAARLIEPPPSPASEVAKAEQQANPPISASTSTEGEETPEGREAVVEAKAKAGERAAALKTVPAAPFAGGKVLPEEKYGQFKEFEAALTGQPDPGFRKYVQSLLGTGPESPGFRQIRQGFQQSGQEYQQPFLNLAQRAQNGGSLSQEETSKVINPETGGIRQAPQQGFADFIGKEFERLRTDYEQPQLGLREESKTRSAKAKIRSIVR